MKFRASMGNPSQHRILGALHSYRLRFETGTSEVAASALKRWPFLQLSLSVKITEQEVTC